MAIPVVGTAGPRRRFRTGSTALTDWRLTIFGLMILLVVYYLQDGIVGFVRKIVSCMPRRTVTTIDADAGGRTADAVRRRAARAARKTSCNCAAS